MKKLSKAVVSMAIAISMMICYFPQVSAETLKVYAVDATLSTRNGCTADDALQKICTDDENAKLVYGNRIFTFDVAEAGIYKYTYVYQTEWGGKVSLYKGEASFAEYTSEGIGTNSITTESLEMVSGSIELAAGSNSIEAVFDAYDEGMSYYMELAKVASKSVSVETAGTYPVELTYKSDIALGAQTIAFDCNNNTYSLRYPVLDTTENSVVFDMPLAAGVNHIISSTQGVSITKAELYSGTARHYEGEELITPYDPEGYVTDTVAESDGSTALRGRLGPISDNSINSYGVEFTYYAPKAGDYTISMRYATIWAKQPQIYVNGTNYASLDGSRWDLGGENTASITRSATVPMTQGVNNIFVCLNEQSNEMFLDYIDIDVVKAKTLEVSAETAGTYQVKVSYTTDAATTQSAIVLTSGDKRYTIKYPNISAGDKFYVVDMELAQGVNEFAIDSGNINVTGLSICTETLRHYEGEELITPYNPEGYVTDTVTEPDGSTALRGRLGPITDNPICSTGVEFTYYAPEAGDYTISMRYATFWLAKPQIYVNGTKCAELDGSRWDLGGENTASITRSATIPMKQGINNVFVCLSDNSNQMFLDYIDIDTVKPKTINAETAGTYQVKVSYTTDAFTTQSAIVLTSGEKSYTIKYPAIGGGDKFYVVDMELAQGVNEFTVGNGSINVTGLSIYTEAARHYEGEELITPYDPEGYVTDTVTEADGSTALRGRLGPITGNSISNTGVEFTYYAPEAGDYTITMRYATFWLVQPQIYVNGTNCASLDGSRWDLGGENTASITRSATIPMEQGVNNIFVCLADNSNQMFLDYIDIDEVKPQIVYVGELDAANITDGTAGLIAGYAGNDVKDKTTNGNETIGSFVRFPVNISVDGNYTIKVYYACRKDNQAAKLYVDTADKTISNGNWEYSMRDLDYTDESGNVVPAPFMCEKIFNVSGLMAGEHTIVFETEDGINGGLYINRIEVMPLKSTGLDISTVTAFSINDRQARITTSLADAYSYSKTEENIGKQYFSMQLYNGNGETEKTRIIIVSFDGDMLEKCILEDVKIGANADENYYGGIDITEDTTQVKLFVWKTDNMAPIIENVLIK